LIGGSGNDIIRGGSGNDLIVGNAGNDTIDGVSFASRVGRESGRDTINSGDGNDYISASLYDIIDGGVGVDYLELTYEGRDLGGNTLPLSISIVVNSDGTGAVTDITRPQGSFVGGTFTGIENFTFRGVSNPSVNQMSTALYGTTYVNASASNYDVRLFGTPGSDTLLGGAGNDLITAAIGSDSLDGGAGNDTLIGGADVYGDRLIGGSGNEDYGVYSSNTLIIENADGGIDTVWAQVNYSLTANVENLYLFGAITGNGNSEKNTISGDDSNQIINGLGGDDTLYGGAGDDTLDGGISNDFLVGDAGNDSLIGGDGNDSLINDAVGGRDTLVGGNGDDNYAIYDVRADILERTGEGIDSVWTSLNYTLGSNLENLYLVSDSRNNSPLIANGNNINNIIYAVDIRGCVLNGMDGNDTLYGSEADDTIDGGAASDMMFGNSGADIFAFRFGQSSYLENDRILDFTVGSDKIALFPRAGIAALTPTSLSSASLNTTATTLLELAQSVYIDANDALDGNQSLASGGSALVTSSAFAIAGTYLIIDDGVDGFSNNDLVINISGSIPSDLSILSVNSYFI
jgi:Ca2+-binding RTX toxin-like protein